MIYVVFFPDDYVVIAAHITRRVHWVRLKVKFGRPEYFVVSVSQIETFKMHIKMKGCSSFKYLGSIFDKTDTGYKDIWNKISQG
jgi:hypothetical protein